MDVTHIKHLNLPVTWSWEQKTALYQDKHETLLYCTVLWDFFLKSYKSRLFMYSMFVYVCMLCKIITPCAMGQMFGMTQKKKKKLNATYTRRSLLGRAVIYLSDTEQLAKLLAV